MSEVNTEALALVEKWARETCPQQTLTMKEIHVLYKLCELSIWTFKDKGVAQCHPRRQYLADLVGWGVTKVSRCTSFLRDLKLLKKQQPRVFNQQEQRWEPLPTIYRVSFLGLTKIRQLAWILKIDIRAHMTFSFPKTGKKENESCVQPKPRKPSIVGNIARQVYQRVMNMSKSIEEPKGEIKTSNIALNGLLNRFANLGKGQGEVALTQAT